MSKVSILYDPLACSAAHVERQNRKQPVSPMVPALLNLFGDDGGLDGLVFVVKDKGTTSCMALKDATQDKVA